MGSTDYQLEQVLRVRAPQILSPQLVSGNWQAGITAFNDCQGSSFPLTVQFFHLEVLYEQQPWGLVQPIKTSLPRALASPEQWQTRPDRCPPCASQGRRFWRTEGTRAQVPVQQHTTLLRWKGRNTTGSKQTVGKCHHGGHTNSSQPISA